MLANCMTALVSPPRTYDDKDVRERMRGGDGRVEGSQKKVYDQ